ncbi:uncharacterized protein J3D65DRAFT_565471 [Phyllosticta citribraziliensis]|uniref:Uncharacterized protein n=1 Tax=Phyllosticta citribraziliensis TaxID=989973 RepID=A0ABR1M3P8_9PEZI
MAKVALITGGASGIGLAVATLLSERTTPPWHIHIVDMNPSAGAAAAASLPCAKFHHADVSDYSALSIVFAAIFASEGRLDFVFGNAGIVERLNFIDAATKQMDAEGEGDAPPPSFPEGAMKVLDVNLKSVLYTVFLAAHYMIRKQEGGDLVLTSSAAGIYPSALAPVYTSAKHGVLGLARSIAPRLHASHNIRVNAMCPGVVPTSLLSAKEWDQVDIRPETWTPVSCVANAVLRIVDCGTDLERPVVDSIGKEVKVGEMFGRAVECSGERWYWRDPLPFCDERMELALGADAQKMLWSEKRLE